MTDALRLPPARTRYAQTTDIADFSARMENVKSDRRSYRLDCPYDRRL